MIATEPRAPARARPFTLPHFRSWARGLVLDTGEPWEIEPFQAAFVKDVFSGVPEAWWVIPEGNTKTTTLAGLGLYHIEHRAGGLVPVAASSREQAEVLYQQAAGFVLRSPALRGRFRCLEGYRRIRYDPLGARIQIFAADDRTGDGQIPTLCLLDELHRHPDLRLYRTWRGKIEKRGGQVVAISTAGEPGGEFEETRERIRQAATEVTRRGCFLRAASPELVLHEWAVPEKGDVEDLRLVKAANPFSGVTLRQLERKRNSPTMTLSHWRRFNCNLPTRSDAAAIQEAEWHRAASAEEIPPGEPIWLGLDLHWRTESTAAVPLWMPSPTSRLLGPAAVLPTPRDGASLDPETVKRALVELHRRNPLHTVVMATMRGEDLAQWIAQEFGAEIVDRPASVPLAELDYERFMEALRNGWLHHAGDGGLTRHALNAVTRMSPGGKSRFMRPSPARDEGAQLRVINALTAAAQIHGAAAAELNGDEGWGLL